jgi:hypothetical protein
MFIAEEHILRNISYVFLSHVTPRNITELMFLGELGNICPLCFPRNIHPLCSSGT